MICEVNIAVLSCCLSHVFLPKRTVVGPGDCISRCVTPQLMGCRSRISVLVSSFKPDLEGLENMQNSAALLSMFCYEKYFSKNKCMLTCDDK